MFEWIAHLSTAGQTAFFGIPAALLLALLGHRLGMRKQSGDVSAQFSKLQMEALAQREKTVTDQQTSIQAMLDKHEIKVDSLNQQIGEAHADIRALREDAQRRDQRERELLREIGALTQRLKRAEECEGGAPCPFRKAG